MLWIWSHFVVFLRSDLDVKQTHLWGWFVEQNLMLSSNFRCCQIHYCWQYEFGHTVVFLKSDLGVKQTHLWWIVFISFNHTLRFMCWRLSIIIYRIIKSTWGDNKLKKYYKIFGNGKLTKRLSLKGKGADWSHKLFEKVEKGEREREREREKERT